MAVVTATIAAVSATMAAVSTIGAAAAGAATVGAAVAATASAVVAVANVVGMVGLAVTAVGMVTKNEDLLKAGKIMGYVGLGGNLLGFGVGFAAEGFKAFSSRMGDLYASSWDKGMGKMFSSSADDVAGGAGAAATNQPAPAGNANFTQAPGAKPGIGEFPAPGGPQPTDLTGINPAVKPGTGFLNNPQATAPTPIASGVGDPNAALQSSIQSATSVSTPKPMDFGVAQGMSSAAPVGGTAPVGGGLQGFLNNPMLPLAAGQIISGGAGGLFTGAAKEEEVEMLRQQNERNEAQRQYLNRNNQFVPGTV